jgi:hypothetical protein
MVEMSLAELESIAELYRRRQEGIEAQRRIRPHCQEWCGLYLGGIANRPCCRLYPFGIPEKFWKLGGLDDYPVCYLPWMDRPEGC